MNDQPTDGEVLEAINDIAYQQEIKAQWDILSKATDDQIYNAIGAFPSTHVVSLIRRLIERAYLK